MVLGRATVSSKLTMLLHPCMPPQQISPSAANRSPWASATSHASRNVSAISFVLATGFSAHSWTPVAESMRTTPYGRTPRSRSFCAMRQAFSTIVTKRLRSSALPIADRRPNRRYERADRQILGPDKVGESLERVVARVDAGVRVCQKQVDAIELYAIDAGRSREINQRRQFDWRFGV